MMLDRLLWNRKAVGVAFVAAASVFGAGCSSVKALDSTFTGLTRVAMAEGLVVDDAAPISAEVLSPAPATDAVPATDTADIDLMLPEEDMADGDMVDGDMVDEATGAISKQPATPFDKSASSYEAFTRDVDAIADMALKTPNEVRKAVDRLMKHSPQTLSEGWIAYGARIALLNADFAAGVSREVERRGVNGVIKKMEKDPRYLRKMHGAYGAIADLLEVVEADTKKLDKLGERFISTAYEFQKNKKWGKRETDEPQYAEGAGVLQPAAFGKSSKKSVTPSVTDQVLKLAARLAMTDEAEKKSAKLSDLVHDAGLSQCLRWARLNLNQCMAAAYFPSEEAYCTGKHGITEVSACWEQLVPTGS